MVKLWCWLKQSSNREVIAWLLVGITSVAAYFGFIPPKTSEVPLTTPPSASASASASASTVSVQVAPEDHKKQESKAGEKGISINADGSSTVTVKVHNR
jgi:hypothetical protein